MDLFDQRHQLVFAGRVVSHRRKAPVRSPLAARRTVWTTPQYAREETAHLQAEELRKQAEQEERRRRLEEARARWAQEQEGRERARAGGDHQAAVQALLERQAALEKPVFYFVHQETGAYPFVPHHGTPTFAMGVPVYLGLTPYGVICPVASRVAAVRDRLAKLVVFVASEGERRRIAAQARPEQRIEVLDGSPAALPSPPPPPPPPPPAGQEALPLPGVVDDG